MKKVNYLRILAYTVGFLLFVLGVTALASTNETHVLGDYTVVYPSTLKSLALFHSATKVWAVVTVLLTAFAAYVVEAFGTETGDWLGNMSVGKIIFLIGVPVVFALVSLFSGAYNVQDFTHKTFKTSDYKEVKASSLDKQFTKAYQTDSLYLTANDVK